jgi:HAD superfamily hydrolase (TIGR01549 family)
MKLSNKKYLVFDFDGTIGDLIIDWSRSRESIIELTKKLTGENDLIIEGNPYVFESKIIKKIGKKAAEAYIDLSRSFEKKNYSGHQPNMRIVNFIIDNRDKYKFFLFTSNHSETINPVLEDLGIIDVFYKIITRDSVVHPKPDPDGFSQIIDSNVDKKEYLMIGDTSNDELAAKNAGIDFIHVVDFEQEIQK